MGLLSRIRDRRQIELDERSPELDLKYSDLLVLEQLVRSGGDPRAPRHVLYFLYFDVEGEASAAAAEAEANGFEIEVAAPEAGVPQWRLMCERHDYVLDPDVVRANTDFFESIANRHGGQFDGWEASVS